MLITLWAWTISTPISSSTTSQASARIRCCGRGDEAADEALDPDVAQLLQAEARADEGRPDERVDRELLDPGGWPSR